MECKWEISLLAEEEKERLKHRMEDVLSEILSDKYDCEIRLKFIPKGEN